MGGLRKEILAVELGRFAGSEGVVKMIELAPAIDKTFARDWIVAEERVFKDVDGTSQDLLQGS